MMATMRDDKRVGHSTALVGLVGSEEGVAKDSPHLLFSVGLGSWDALQRRTTRIGPPPPRALPK